MPDMTLLFLFLLPALAMAQDPVWVMQTTSMPTDDRLVAAVGNSHVASQVYLDTMYVNDVYNGFGNTSHRARIPSTISIQPDVTNPTTNFALDMQKGVFFGYFNTAEYNIEQRIYAHRTRTRILVNEILVTRQSGSGSLTIPLLFNQGPPSTDLDLTTVQYDIDTQYTSGPIVEAETDTSPVRSIHQYWTSVPASITLLDGENSRTWRYLTAISIDQSDALNAFQSAKATVADELFNENTAAWGDIWRRGDITVQGEDADTDLQQTIHAALFHILISTPDLYDPINPFGGLSPGGLARGGKINNNTSSYNDYLGHVFWDMDTWILPAILMFHPEMARLMIESRYRVIDAARAHARDSGYVGVRYPWEQAFSGSEVCPWDLAALYQIHVTADIAYSIRQYLYSTADTQFVNDTAKELAMEIARFWESRSVLIDQEKGYEILGVMGPDENSANVNNSGFTNFNAKLSLSTPQYMIDKLNVQFSSSELAEIGQFNMVADNMYMPFNETLQFHPQFDGFDHTNATIKQSDVVLLGYPLMKNMTPEVRKNDLVLYEELTDKFGPDTGTWSMHTVGWLELGNATKAEDMFEYMLRNINGPFKIFSEKPSWGPDGMRATNFITLAGGMLQAVLFGYGGVRVREGQMDMNPYILPNSTAWSMTGFHYRGSSLDFDITDADVSLTLTLRDPGADVLVLLTSTSRDELTNVGVPVVVTRGPMTLVTLSEEGSVAPV